MHPTVDIQPNTILADLDEGLRRLLRAELSRQGLAGVAVAFDAPTREWAATLSTPTVDLFLHDLREDSHRRSLSWQERRGNGTTRERRPPLMLAAAYAITAWTRGVEDEHRLLSQVLGILHSHPILPADVRVGSLADPDGAPIETRLGQPRTVGGAEFWTAVGGQFKASIELTVAVACPSGFALERGPAVRTRAVVAEIRDVGRPAREERHALTGRVLAADGEPEADAWIVLPDRGRFTTSDAAGAFMIDGLPPGRHRCLVRGGAGATSEHAVAVPGSAVELTLRPARRRGHR